MNQRLPNIIFGLVVLIFCILQVLTIDHEVGVDEISSHCQGAGVSYHTYPDAMYHPTFTQDSILNSRSLKYTIAESFWYDRSAGTSYIATLYPIMTVFGPSHRVGRIYSIILGLLCLLVLRMLLLRIGISYPLANLIPAALAFNALFFSYSGAMRHYIFPLLFELLAAYLIIRLSNGNQEKSPWYLYALLFLSVVLGTLGHHLVVIFVGSFLLIPFFRSLATGEWKRSVQLFATVSAGITVFFTVLFLFYHFGVMKDFARQDYWTQIARGEIPHSMYEFGMVRLPTLKWLSLNIIRTITEFVGVDLTYLEVGFKFVGLPWLLIFPFILLVACVVYKWRERIRTAFINADPQFAWVFFPLAWILFAIALSLVKGNTTIFLERYMLFSIPLGLIVLAILIDKTSPRIKTLVGVSLILLGFVFNLPRLMGRHLTSPTVDQDYKYSAAADFIKQNYTTGDTVVYSNMKTALVSSLYLGDFEPVQSQIFEEPKWDNLEVLIKHNDDTIRFDGGIMYSFN